MDQVYGLPFTRRPHPAYGAARIPAFEVVENSVQIMRGCFGGCTFCSITAHEGRIIQSRSPGIGHHRDQAARQPARLQGHGLRHRRPDRQHVPDAVHAAGGGGQVPAALLRASHGLQAARHRPRPAQGADARGAERRGREAGARGQRRAHGPGPPRSRISRGARRAPRRRPSEGGPGAHRSRGARR